MASGSLNSRVDGDSGIKPRINLQKEGTKLKRIPIPLECKEIIEKDKLIDKRSQELVNFRYQTKIEELQTLRHGRLSPKRLQSQRIGDASPNRNQPSPLRKNTDLNITAQRGANMTPTRSGFQEVIAEEVSFRAGGPPGPIKEMQSTMSLLSKQGDQVDQMLQRGGWRNRLKDQSNMSIGERQDMVEKGKEKLKQKFMVRQYTMRKPSNFDFNFGGKEQKKPQRGAQLSMGNISGSISGAERLSPKMENDYQSQRGEVGQSLPKLDKVFRLETPKNNFESTKMTSQTPRMPLLQTQGLNKRLNKLNAQSQAGSRNSPSDAMLEKATLDQSKVKLSRNLHQSHKSALISSKIGKMRQQKTDRNPDQPRGDQRYASQNPWQTDRIELEQGVSAGKHGRNKMMVWSQNIRESANIRSSSHLNDTEEELEDSSQYTEESHDELKSLKIEEVTNLKALKAAVRQKKLASIESKISELEQQEQEPMTFQQRFAAALAQKFNTSSIKSVKQTSSMDQAVNYLKHLKKKRYTQAVEKLAMRDYLREQGFNRTETEMQLQEIYNRYFFFRKEEVTTQDQQDKDKEVALKEAKIKRQKNRMSQSVGHMNFEEFEQKNLTQPIVSRRNNPVKMTTENTSTSQLLDIQSSSYTLQGLSRHQLGSSVHEASPSGASQSLMLDQISVREIMDSCSGTIGKVGYRMRAKQELEKIAKDKERTDDAMDRLKNLFEEYYDQLYKETPTTVAASQAKNQHVKEFLLQQQKVKKRATVFVQGPNSLMNDEKSVDLIMRDDLHNECFINRCFDSPEQIKKQVTAAHRKYQPKKSKKTKNPVFWKPDPLKYSKHLQELLDTGIYS